MSPVPPLDELIPNLLRLITCTTDLDHAFVPFQNDGTDQVILLVNNLGGLSELELGVIVKETTNALDQTGIIVLRVLAGTFMVGLMMRGPDRGIDGSRRLVSTCQAFHSPFFCSLV